MPTYEYKCADCGADLEIVQSIHDASLTECPECGGTLRKQFGNVGVVFKGSGFYKTDSRSSEKKSPASSTKSTKSADNSSSTTSDSSSSDSKRSEAKKSESKKSSVDKSAS